jgi:ABC-type multidrug transport system ATPase subunit
MSSIHLVIGFTPQFSVLWDTLTVQEHLLFYSRLKGIHPHVESDHVERTMKNFGLYNTRNKLASELSGGTKRRLSIAIAVSGDSSLVFLDEPVLL